MHFFKMHFRCIFKMHLNEFFILEIHLRDAFFFLRVYLDFVKDLGLIPFPLC